MKTKRELFSTSRESVEKSNVSYLRHLENRVKTKRELFTTSSESGENQTWDIYDVQAVGENLKNTGNYTWAFYDI